MENPTYKPNHPVAKTPKVQALTHFFCMEHPLLPSIPGTDFGSPGHLCFFQALPEKTNLNSPGTVETKSAVAFEGSSGKRLHLSPALRS